MIQFLLNNELIEVSTCAPSLSILDWLRIKKGKTGTKEGCASGDCGACTVVIGDLIKGQWQYKSINACLMLVGNLHGKHLITVEALTQHNNPSIEQLHPVQRAMVECHGSQCGFCTPGIIMSLFALYMNNASYPGKHEVIHALGGNLCRCTGYQPIIKAAEKCFSYPRVDTLKNIQLDDLQQTIEASITGNIIPFLQFDAANTLNKTAKHTQYFYLPQNLTQLTELKAQHPQAKFVAGGTDLSLEFSQQLKSADVLISVNYCAELKQYQQTELGISIGAALPYSDFIDDFCQIFPESTELFERLGSRQVRNTGSLGGSIGNASPIGDPAPLFIALNSQIELQSIRGKRLLPLETFFIDYRKTQLAEDEVIVALHIPARSPSLQLACHKVSKRIEDDISTVCLALAFELTHDNIIKTPRCAMGGMAAIPARAKQIETSLTNQYFNLEHLQSAAALITQDFNPMSDVRASAQYRLQVSKNLFDRIWYQHNAIYAQQPKPQASKADSTESLSVKPDSTISTRVDHAAL